MAFKRKRPKVANGQHRTTKLALNSILRDKYRLDVVNLVANWCHLATIISVLASLLFLYKVNRAFDDDNQDFFRGNGYTVIEGCFNSILFKNQHKMPVAFRRLVCDTVPNFRWPEKQALGNAFNKLVDQYKTNVKNNIKIWSYSRIHTFFKVKRYEMNLTGKNISDIDVKNATKAVMFNNITRSANVDELLGHATMIGIPVGQRLCDIVRQKWFQTIPIFVNIQRVVFVHHERYDLLNDMWHRYHRDPNNNPKPSIPRPPKIRNFRVIPIHDYHMKHIRIDTHLFFEMACKLGALKLAIGATKNKVNISKDEFYDNEVFCWDRVFKMDKINAIGKQRTFDFAIVTDSVDASLCFVKPQSDSVKFTDEQIADMYDNNSFDFVLGMDPGVRTWNATVRKHIQSGVEVHNAFIVYFQYRY